MQAAHTPLSSSPQYYVISGLTVRSSVELPSAIQAESVPAEPDVVIEEGALPEKLDAAERGGKDWEIEGSRMLLRIGGVMRVLIEDGRRITLQRCATAVEGDVVLFLLGTCFAAILQQRGRVVLHASAVAVNGRAMLFCGPSGAGKSTLAAMLSRRGYPLLNDDVCNLSRREGDIYEVYPDGRMLKLWSESLQHLRVDADEKYRIRSDAEKFYLSPEKVDLSPRMVGGVYMIHRLPEGESALLKPLPVAEAMMELAQNAYRPGLVQAMQMQPDYFQAWVSIARTSGLFRLSRAKDFSRADEVLDLLETSWASMAQ